jgi:mannose-6-phosphate isomerase-like protein (cupin superfamily)
MMTRILTVASVLLFVVAALGQDAAKLVYVPGKQIEEDIRKAPANNGEQEINLIERTPGHAGILLRRTLPGKAEVHETETDIWYVIDGGCILVTGGSLIDAKQESPGQIRGSGISGGEERKIGKGDFIRIPNGVPHWVKKIDGGEIVYTVVKYVEPK